MDLILVMGLLLGAVVAGSWSLESEFKREMKPNTALLISEKQE